MALMCKLLPRMACGFGAAKWTRNHTLPGIDRFEPGIARRFFEPASPLHLRRHLGRDAKGQVAELVKARRLATPDSSGSVWLVEEPGSQCKLWFDAGFEVA